MYHHKLFLELLNIIVRGILPYMGYSYVRSQTVSGVSILDVISFGLKKGMFLHSFLELGIIQFLTAANFFIIIDKSINKSPSQCLQ